MAREYEWKKLRKYLSDNNITIVNGRSGCGSQTYSSNRRLNPPYDLSNWRWIDITLKNGGMAFISFQPFDKDNNTNNSHVLFDRIGISWYEKRKDNSNLEKQKETAMIINNMFITDIELPLDENKMNKICDIIKFLSDNITIEKFTWKQISKEIEK